MKKAYQRLLCLFILAAIAGCLIFSITASVKELASGDTVPNRAHGSGYFLRDFSYGEGGARSLHFYMENPGSMTLVVLYLYNFPYTVKVCGQDALVKSSSMNLEFVPLMGNSPAEIQIYAERWVNGSILMLVDNNRASLLAHIFIPVQYAMVPLIALLLLYALSMYYYKNTEKYILHYAFYLLFLFVWMAFEQTMSRFSSNTELLHVASDLLLNVINHMTAIIYMKLLNIRLGRFTDIFFHPACIVFWVLSATALNWFFPPFQNILLLAELLNLMAITLKREDIPLALFLGLCYMLIRSFFNVLFRLWIVPNDILFEFICRSKFSYVLYSVCVMLYINRRYALKFQDAERYVLQLRDLNGSLDAKVKERTMALEREEALRHGMMLNVFHDLRSPLFVLQGCVETMPAESQEALENLAVMRERTAFISHLTEELFMLAKLEEGEILMNSEPIELHEVLGSLLLAERVAAGEEVYIKSNLAEGCLILGDRFYLYRVFQNLLENAIRFTPKGGKISVTLERRGQDAIISVTDTGKGIGQTDMADIFQRYYVGKSSNRQKSSGLGLSIAKMIVEQLNGRIEAQSKPGCGTSFIVVFPLYGEDETPDGSK